MPHFTLPILPSGPLMDAFVGVSDARRTALQSLNQPIPNPIQVRALIDTGASGTCVDPSVMTALALTPKGQIQMCTPSTGAVPHTADQYDVSIFIPCGANPAFVRRTLGVACVELAAQGFHVLIGRDILRACLLTYNGTTGSFTLAY
jgi:predicted aspartyl protease